MQEITLSNGVKLLHYSDGDEMPLNRYMAFQRYLLHDAGIGNDMNSVNGHFARFHEFIGMGKMDMAAREAENLHFNMFSIIERINFQGLAFGCLLHSIDDDVLTDYSEAALTRLVDRLSELGLTQGQARAANEAAKKKIFDTLKRFYPEFFPDDLQLELFVKIARKIELEDLLINVITKDGDEEPIRAEIREIDEFILTIDTPKNFRPDDEDNEAVQMDLNYMNLCSTLEGSGIQNAASLSVLEFYSRLSFLKKQAKAGPRNPA